MEKNEYDNKTIIELIEIVEDELIHSNMDLIDEMKEFTHENDVVIYKLFFENK